MSKAGGKGALLTSALIVAAIRMWSQLRGTTKTPFHEWAIGWGATFFLLALLSEIAPAGAGALSLIVAFSDFLANGVSLTTDISKTVTGAETGNLFVPNPFASGGGSSTVSSARSKSKSSTTGTTPKGFTG